MSPTANPVLASIRHTEYHSQNNTLFRLSRITCPGCNCNKNFWPLYLTHTLGVTVSIVLHMISKYNPFFNWTSLSLFLFPPVHCSSCVMKHKWMMTQSFQTVTQYSSVLYQWVQVQNIMFNLSFLLTKLYSKEFSTDVENVSKSP